MAKTQRFVLDVDDDAYERFDIIGICCVHKDYRLAFTLNKRLNLHFNKADQFFEVFGKKGALLSTHPFYCQREIEGADGIFLIKNKHEGKWLIPEQDKMDYFLFVVENQEIDVNEWVEELKREPLIVAAFSFEQQALKSTEKLYFS